MKKEETKVPSYRLRDISPVAWLTPGKEWSLASWIGKPDYFWVRYNHYSNELSYLVQHPSYIVDAYHVDKEQVDEFENADPERWRQWRLVMAFYRDSAVKTADDLATAMAEEYTHELRECKQWSMEAEYVPRLKALLLEFLVGAEDLEPKNSH